tara:strand:- start:1625 stop:1813 length:189 start_codon:yes stop_codon:yes gene_type:complete
MQIHSDLIDQLGGTRRVANFLHVPTQYVSKWRRRGIPWRHRWKVSTLAHTAGVRLPKEFMEC